MRVTETSWHNCSFINTTAVPVVPSSEPKNIPGEEHFEFLSLGFSLRIAQELAKAHDLIRVEPAAVKRWLEHARIDEHPIDHIPPSSGHSIMASLPAGCKMPLIDGNHRAARALRDGSDFFAAVLDENETLELLRRSMGKANSDDYWKRMLASKTHSMNK